MPPPLILRILGDAISYFKTAESTIATNTKLASSFGLVGRDAKLSADAQIAAINSQLLDSVTNAYGDYKKASVKGETAGLGLTAARRRALEQRLSQRGPGGTTPMAGVGAGGYVIDPSTGRPIHRHNRGHHGSRRIPYTGPAGGRPEFNPTIDLNLNVEIDGKQVQAVVTKHQQTHRRRSPSSRRGPNAATATA